MNGLALFRRAAEHRDRAAFIAGDRRFSYACLLQESARLASTLLQDREDLDEERIVFQIPAGTDYAIVQWAIWRAGGIAVPLTVGAALPELRHALTSAQVNRAIVQAKPDAALAELYASLGVELLVLDQLQHAQPGRLPALSGERRAMILFTSGTTSKPKGVVISHANIQAQVETLVQEWEWRADDRIPLFLPLHHVHGIVNVLTCALWSGACVEPFASFAVDHILQRVAADAYTLFMAVPTIYVKLIQKLQGMDAAARGACCGGFRRMRLMISGSAALPADIHQVWEQLTGQKLLERYGMTEIGMAISNPVHGERRPGAVGKALPGVAIRLVAESGRTVEQEGEPGEIWVKGPTVFREYWNNPQATSAAFSDGWFITGDMAVIERGYYRIMGRLSVDIIKSGGYKLSALEIEDVLLTHPLIVECAVVGVAHPTWGEAVAAAAVLAEGASLELEELRAWAGDKLSRYKLPQYFKTVPALPRNAMGKVTKPAVKEMF
jgi:malonyl-CoA/methylmalonyl-CoA synthetase